MPEGDTIHYAANRIRPVLEGHVPDELTTPHPRFARDGWAERLQGQAVRSVDAHGKHLFLRFEGGLTIHSHLRMTGKWGIYERGQPWKRPQRQAWLVARRDGGEVVQFNGPVLELMTDSRARLDRRIAGLGPDIIKPAFDEDEFLRRLRHDDPTRPIGDALLEQRTIAGIGNMWKIEGCFQAGIDPWRPSGKTTDEEALRIVRGIRPLMQESAVHGMQDAYRTIYKKGDRPCPRCGGRIQTRGQGDDNRITYWCSQCQV